MNLTGLYCLVLYLTFFFDMYMFVNNYLNPSINKSNSFFFLKKNRIIYKCVFLSDLSDDLDDVFVDNKEFDEFL